MCSEFKHLSSRCAASYSFTLLRDIGRLVIGTIQLRYRRIPQREWRRGEGRQSFLKQNKESKHFTWVIVFDIFFKILFINSFSHLYSASCATAARSGPYLIQSDLSRVCTSVFVMILKTFIWFLSVNCFIAFSFWSWKITSSAKVWDTQICSAFEINTVFN